MFNHPYICLSTKDDLDNKNLLNWFRAVAESGPSGVISAVELHADNKPQRFYQRHIDGMNRYCVVLSRDLEGEEVNKIAHATNQTIPDGDWEISFAGTTMYRRSLRIVSLIFSGSLSTTDSWPRLKT